MKVKFYLLFSLWSFIACNNESNRVKIAYAENEATLKETFKNKGWDWSFKTFLRVFKAEKELEVWIIDSNSFKLFKKYPICAMSGDLGRKLKQGDMQVPEGIYYINRFNPKSDFFLSLGLNYPNVADKIAADQEHPGGDIFIHGNCMSAGCMAMTDVKIKEIYLLANEAKMNGQSDIPLHIFPFRMTEDNFDKYVKDYPQWIVFWQSLKRHYDIFEQNKALATIMADDLGNYK